MYGVISGSCAHHFSQSLLGSNQNTPGTRRQITAKTPPKHPKTPQKTSKRRQKQQLHMLDIGPDPLV
jgi:hypothetical protein